jgi:mono/diheme cytochrome c family protein
MIRRVARCQAGLVICAVLWSCQGSSTDRTGSAGGEATVYATNGARIFYTAVSQSGSPILTADAFGEAPALASRACADCHGADGGGGVIRTDTLALRTPAIDFARLSAPDTYAGGRAYDEASLALTLRTGVRIDGYLLSPAMPRWTMSSEDMLDLIEHLKSLGPQATR